MKATLRSFKIASWALLIGGMIHTIADLFSPSTPQKEEILNQMKAFNGQVLGTTFDLASFFQGFSLMMGLLLIGYGAINVLLLKNNQGSALPTNILILNIIITFVTVLISIKYFFIIPVILTSIPFVGYLISFITKTSKA